MSARSGAATVVQSLGDELAAATPEAIQQIVALPVARVETADRAGGRLVADRTGGAVLRLPLLSLWRPRTVLGERASHEDPLAWYAGVA